MPCFGAGDPGIGWLTRDEVIEQIASALIGVGWGAERRNAFARDRIDMISRLRG